MNANQLAGLIRRHCDEILTQMLVNYQEAYTYHRQLIREAKELNQKGTKLPVSLIADGIESRLRVTRLTQELMQAIIKLPAVANSQQWGIKYKVQKYNTGVMKEDEMVRLCVAVSAKFKNKTEEKEC